MASIKVFDSIEKLKSDRVKRTLSKEEVLAQKKAAYSIKNIKKKKSNTDTDKI